MIKNSRTVLIDKNPGRNAQTFGIARELGTDLELIHEPSVGVIGNKGDSQCYVGVYNKVQAIQSCLKARIGTSDNPNDDFKKLSRNKISSEANADELNIRRESISNLIFMVFL